MPHGTPDWGLVGPKQTTYGLDDLGEHAVRLGSPHLSDRRGDVLWLTDFDEGIGPMEAIFNGAAGGVALMTEHSRQGPYCVRLISGSDGAADAYGRMTLPIPTLSLIGNECSFGWDAILDYFQIEIWYYDGTDHWDGVLRYDPLLNELQYWAGGLVWTALATGVNLPAFTRVIHTFKLVVDLTTIPPSFTRAVLNTITYSFPAGIPLIPTASGVGPYIECYYRNQSILANRTVYIDNCIITHNEPA